MERTVEEIFISAWNFFQDKTRWAQGYYNFDKFGKKCGWAGAHSFCALGAVSFFSEGDSHKAQCCLQRISEHLYGKRIQDVNDNDPDAYNKVLAALKFGTELWHGVEPTIDEVSASVSEILEKRNGQSNNIKP